MNSVEAIERLKQIADWRCNAPYCDTECEKCAETQSMAIEALKLQEADECTGCTFISTKKWEMPCKKCKRNSKDYWEAEKND